MSDGGRVVVIKEGHAPKVHTVPPPVKTVKPLKSILKVKGVADPAKSPPLRKTAKRSRIQIMTDAGSKKYRRTIRRKLASMSNKRVKELAEKHGLIKGKNTPPQLMRHILEGGITAGFVSDQ